MELADMNLPVVADENGEKLQPHLVYTNANQTVRIVDTTQRKVRVKHSKFRDSRDAKRAMHKLTTNERSLLATLFQYLDWETNVVVGDGELGVKGKPLTFVQIDTISGMSKPTRVKTIQSLEEKKVIGYLQIVGKRAGIVVNPLYGYKGYRPSDKLKTYFGYEVDVDNDCDGDIDDAR